MSYPKITIVTPNYNGEAFLEETIQSVISQNYPNLEYIIIDGGSTDGSLSIIKKYEKFLAHWKSEADNGLYEALQKGFELSTGEIMGWINSDDIYHPKAFLTLAEIFGQNPEVHWLQGIPSIIDERGRTVLVQHLRKWSKLDYYLGNYKWIQQESTFWRRSLWEKAGRKVSSEMKYAGDLELWLRFFRHEKLYVTSALIGGFRQRADGQLSLKYADDYANEAEEKIHEELEKIPTNEKIILNKIKRQKQAEITKNGYLKKIIKFLDSNFISKEDLEVFAPPPKVYFDRFSQKFVVQKE